MKRVCIVVSAEMTLRAFLMDQLRALGEAYDLSVVANSHDDAFLRQAGIRARLLPVAIERPISPAADLAALLKLILLFRRERFDVVHSVTPKAGLLAMLAGFLAAIPTRIHVFTGQVWATKKGSARLILKFADRLIAFCATHVLVDSLTQRDFLLKERVVSPEKSRVLANGSICGVDPLQFSPDWNSRQRIRDKIGAGPTDTVFLYVGRLNKEKGLLDLARAFAQVCGSRNDLHLLVVGPDEEGLGTHIAGICAPYTNRIHMYPSTTVPEQFMAAADVLCLPSYREGFGSVIIEAASVGIPAIGSRIYGIIDAIQENVTGLLHQPGNVADLAEKMGRLADDAKERSRMGSQARIRAHQDFSQELVTAALLGFLESSLNQ